MTDFTVEFFGGGTCKLYELGETPGTAEGCWELEYRGHADVSFTHARVDKELSAIPADSSACQTSRVPTSGTSRRVQVSYEHDDRRVDCTDDFTLSSNSPTCEIKITVKPASL